MGRRVIGIMGGRVIGIMGRRVIKIMGRWVMVDMVIIVGGAGIIERKVPRVIGIKWRGGIRRRSRSGRSEGI